MVISKININIIEQVTKIDPNWIDKHNQHFFQSPIAKYQIYKDLLYRVKALNVWSYH